MIWTGYPANFGGGGDGGGVLIKYLIRSYICEHICYKIAKILYYVEKFLRLPLLNCVLDFVVMFSM